MIDETEHRLRAGLEQLVGSIEISPDAATAARDGTRRRARTVQRAVVATATLAVLLTGVALPLILRTHHTRPTAAVAAAVTVAPSCSQKLSYPVSDTLRGPTGRLIQGQPLTLAVCRYAGLNENQTLGTLVAERVIQGEDAQRLVAALDGGHAAPSGTTNCPNDNGDAVAVSPNGAAGTNGTVVIALTGCQFATNGSYTASTTPQTVASLEELVGQPPPIP